MGDEKGNYYRGYEGGYQEFRLKLIYVYTYMYRMFMYECINHVDVFINVPIVHRISQGSHSLVTHCFFYYQEYAYSATSGCTLRLLQNLRFLVILQ